MSTFNARVLKMVTSILVRQEDYLEECEEYAKSGHRHNYCFHGVNMWVDWDCACGLCENGEINEYSSFSDVLKYARETVADEIANEERIAKAREDANKAFDEFAKESDRDIKHLRETYVNGVTRRM